MSTLRKDLAEYKLEGRVLFVLLTAAASLLLAVATIKIFPADGQSLLILSALALLTAITSAREPIRFPGTDTSVSVSETLTFLAIMILGPFHGVVLAALDTTLARQRVKTRPGLKLFNIASQTLSIYVAGNIYGGLKLYLASYKLITGTGETLLTYALPLIALAFTHYVVRVFLLATITHVSFGANVIKTVRGTFPWEPFVFLAGATVAGLINYAFLQYGIITTAVSTALGLPIPVIIYYTFKTYHDKLNEQELHYQELTSIYDSILEMLAMAIDAKDDVTHDHIQRVKLFARRMGELIGLSSLEIEALKAGALLHDIGKIGVPAYILNKPGKLTEHEFEQMKLHTIIGADMLSNIDFRYPVVPIVRHHHERWDGRGYPDGLKAEQIPITARILTLVDNYDALRSDRPYKRGMSKQEALDYIANNAGVFFDPGLVEIFLSVIDQLEQEAANFKAANSKRVNIKKESTVNQAALQSAKPAAGFAAVVEVDRAKAALNSIAETNQRVTALYEMARTLASNLSVEDTVAILANRLSKLIPFTTCVISLFDPSRSEYESVHAVGRHADSFFMRRRPAEAGITGWVITNQQAMYNTNAVLDLGFLGADVASQYKGVMVCPLIKNKEPLGAIALYSTEIDSYASEHINLMESICQPASDAVYNAITFEQAQRSALTDHMTGLANMRALTMQFDRERARSQRLGASMTLIMIAVNNLDEVASRAQAGSEQVLASVGKLIKQQMRETDLLARFSDNAMIALLPDSRQPEASEVRARILDALAKSDIGTRVAVSLGSATIPDDATSFEEMLQVAQVDCLANSQSIRDFTMLGIKDDLSLESMSLK